MEKNNNGITDAMRAMIEQRVKLGFRDPELLFGFALTLIFMAVMCGGFRMNPVFDSATTMMGYILLGCLGGLLGAFVLQSRSIRKHTRLHERVLLEGNYETVEVLEKLIDRTHHRGKIPKQVIRFQHNGEVVELNTFDLNYARAFPLGRLKVLMHPDVPGVFIPQDAWLAYGPSKLSVTKRYSD